jgi:hypothetical protein
VTRPVALALAALVAMCGFGGTSTQATLRVTLVDRMHARPVEGYVWFVGIDGKPHGVAKRTTTTLRGTTGRHLFTSFIRTCDGNCGYLDPPTHRCGTRLRLPARVTVRLNDTGCRVTVG